ncbi:hypothetical protein FCV25MIE_04031 [Fagus crenata]
MRILLHSSDPVKVEKLFNGSDPDLWRRGPMGLHHQRICGGVDPWVSTINGSVEAWTRGSPPSTDLRGSNPDLRGPVGLMMKKSCEVSSSQLSSIRNRRS